MVAVVLIFGTVVVARLLSAPPKYEEIEARVKELVEKSKNVDEILFGEGLATYKRIVNPADDLKIHKTNEFFENDSGIKFEKIVYYYRTLDEREVYACRDNHENGYQYLNGYYYIYVSKSELSEAEISALKSDFPVVEGAQAPYGHEFYSLVYSAQGAYSYAIPYVEEEYEFYYSASDDAEYDYVRLDAPYSSVTEIRELAESVYILSYVDGIAQSLFDGAEAGGYIERARFVQKEDGSIASLMQKNTDLVEIEQPVYDYSTAKIQWWTSSKNKVRILIKGTRPSTPDVVEDFIIQLQRRNDVWYLQVPLYCKVK